jgi:excisionase family DNA binding protein
MARRRSGAAGPRERSVACRSERGHSPDGIGLLFLRGRVQARRALRATVSGVDLSMGEAAKALGVSIDTLRRWDRTGKLQVTRDERNRRRIAIREVHRLLLESELHQAGDDLAAHIRVRGVVQSSRSHGMKTLVQLQAGPFEITAIVTRDMLRRLELVEGAEAVVTMRATAVLIERADA